MNFTDNHIPLRLQNLNWKFQFTTKWKQPFK